MAEVESINGNPIVADIASESITPVVDAWMTAHPDVTTTVQDGAVSTAKLADGAVTDAKLAQTGGVYSDMTGYSELLNADETRGIFELEVGTVNSNTGENQNWPYTLRSVGYMRLSGKIVTAFPVDGYRNVVFKYDKDKNFLGYVGTTTGVRYDMSDAEFIRLVYDKTTASSVTPELIAGSYIRFESKLLSEFGNSISATNGMLASHSVAWDMAAGQSHSSGSDRIDVSVRAGETFYVNVSATNDVSVTGILVAQSSTGSTVYNIGSMTTNTGLHRYEATAAFEKVGFYMPDSTNAYEVRLDIIKDSTLYKLNIDDDAGEVPSYWTANLDSAIQKVADLQTYQSGVTFGFITDIHWETNYQVSPKLVDYISKHSRVDMWLNGGDTASGDAGDGTQQRRWLYDCIGQFGHCYKFYSLNGNHDVNTIGGGTALTTADIRNTVMPYYSDVTFGNGNYYWFDYRGTRFVCLDTGAVGASDGEQNSWAANVIANSPIPVIVAMHIIKVSHSDSSPCPMFRDLIASVGSNSNLQMIIGGHEHTDYTFTASNGVPVVVLDTDSRFADDGIARVQGTTSEQCLSIVTIDYSAKKINVTRVGTIGQDIALTF